MTSEVKTTYVMEMTSPNQLRGKESPPEKLQIRRAEIPCPELNWFLHQCVGSKHRWGGRDHWGREEWAQLVADPQLETWVAYISGTVAGYFELRRHDDGGAQIVCFGLTPQFIGQGYGGHLLTFAIRRGWEEGANRVWLTTCSHDHEHALKNYEARGLTVIEEHIGDPNPPFKEQLFGG